MRIVLIALMSGCTGIDPNTKTSPSDTGLDDWQPVSHLDVGDLCVESSGGDVDIRVAIQDCLSSSCSRAFSGTCTASLDGTVITVTSDIHWEENFGNVPCTDDCGLPIATCVLEGVADGTYTVVFGDEQMALTLPQTEACSTY